MLILQICHGIVSVGPHHTVDVEYTVAVIARASSPKVKLY